MKIPVLVFLAPFLQSVTTVLIPLESHSPNGAAKIHAFKGGIRNPGNATTENSTYNLERRDDAPQSCGPVSGANVQGRSNAALKSRSALQKPWLGSALILIMYRALCHICRAYVPGMRAFGVVREPVERLSAQREINIGWKAQDIGSINIMMET
ncbi:hypothetical protein D9758_009174 [Tetrapyrgos nigripes]|uniref:Secreted protein n=1 Tax=Tetrapyrgos nigripes TaxID=182062 RepID=A0A8H5G8D9_9AGAR|nr:hypothetical protein D9758_009174 [Tetrapyrgos nigripes]